MQNNRQESGRRYQNNAQRNLDCSDIEGAQPKRLFSGGELGEAGRNIVGHVPAGYNKKFPVARPGMISDVWHLGS